MHAEVLVKEFNQAGSGSPLLCHKKPITYAITTSKRTSHAIESINQKLSRRSGCMAPACGPCAARRFDLDQHCTGLRANKWRGTERVCRKRLASALRHKPENICSV